MVHIHTIPIHTVQYTHEHSSQNIIYHYHIFMSKGTDSSEMNSCCFIILEICSCGLTIIIWYIDENLIEDERKVTKGMYINVRYFVHAHNIKFSKHCCAV